MRLALKRLVCLSVASIFLISISGCATSIRKHPEFKERHKDLKSVAIMPPQTTVYKMTFKGDKIPMNDIAEIMKEITISEVEEQFKEKGYELKKIDLSEEVLEANSELRTTLFNVNKMFTKALEDIHKGRKRKFTYTLGTDINVLADMADADIFIFVNEEGMKKSAGEIVKDVAKGALISAAALLIGVVYIPIPKTAATIIHVAIVDANDGAILWYNTNKMTPDIDPENKKHIRATVRRLIKKFPKIIQPKVEK